MKRLANILAIAAGCLAIAAVSTSYFLQGHWITQNYWVYFHSKTKHAFMLAGALLLLALAVKRFSHRSSARLTLALGATGIGFLILSALFVVNSSIEITNKLQIDRLPTEAKYKFTFDGTSANARIWLKHLGEFKDKPNIHGLEIGSYEGRSSLWFLTNVLTHETSSITCVDLFFDEIESVFDSNVKASGLGHKVIKLKGDSKIVVRNLNKTFDFVYIDGSHVAKDVLTDAVLAWDLVKPGGMIIFDDYGFRRVPSDNQSTALIPQPAIDAFLMAFRHHIDVVHDDYQIIVRKKLEPDLGPENVFVKLKSLIF